MKVNRLETHDRLLNFTKQKDEISHYCQDIINKRPFGDRPFYIFAHKREIGMDERVSIFNQDLQMALVNPFYKRKYHSVGDTPSARILWQPRLTKPKAQTNSMLYKGYPGSDMVKVIWIIPERELWDQYKKGNLTQSQVVVESIDKFVNDRISLERTEEDDAGDEAIHDCYRSISIDARYKKV